MLLTENQKKAIESIDKPTMIIAGAGSGKTEVLTQRLLHILKSEKTNLHQILCVTFTEKAAQELKKRIAQFLPDKTKKDLPWAAIGTFHSFCLNCLQEQAPLLGFSESISVWDEHTARLVLHRHCRKVLLETLNNREPASVLLLEELEFRETLLLLEELMQFRWHFEKTIDHESGAANQKLYQATAELYGKILTSYTAEKKKRQVMDFQDLEIETLSLLKTNGEVLKQYQKRFQHILVDEVQDINDLQKELIETLFHPGKNCLCMVGDPKQSIYRFRGANVEGLQSLSDKVLKSGGHRIELRENFRSRPKILQWINSIFGNLFSEKLFTPLLPTRENTTHPHIFLIPVEGEKKESKETMRKKEARAIANYIHHLRQTEKIPFGEVALLFQSLREIRHYEKAFQQAHLPYRLFGGRGFLNAQEVTDLLFCLKLLVNPEDRLSLVGLMRSPLIGLPDTKITELSLRHTDDLGKALLQRPEARWLKEIAKQKDKMNSADILETIVTETHYDVLVLILDPSGTRRANIEQLIELTRDLEREEEMPLEELLEYFDELKKRKNTLSPSNTTDPSSEACHLMTVHAAKGLQFPVVILPDLIRTPPSRTHSFLFVRNKGLGFSTTEEETLIFKELKKEDKEQDLEERKRLLYVALTRAEEKIVIPWHEEAKRTGPWYMWLGEALTLASKVFPAEMKELEKSGERKQYTPLKKLDPRDFHHPLSYYTVTELEKHARGNKREQILFPRQETTITGAALGNIVHAVLKNIHENKKTPLQNLLQKTFFEQGIIANAEEQAMLFHMMEAFLKSDIAPSRWDGFHELPFRLKLPNAFIIGTIDYAQKTDQGWILYDFKTDKQMDPQKYRLQMDVYALALFKGTTEPVLQTELLYLRHNQKSVQFYSPEQLEQIEENLIEFIDAMIKTEN